MRIIARVLALALSLALIAVPAHGSPDREDPFDIASMSDIELLAHRSIVENELVKRGETADLGSPIYSGVYVVGKDIIASQFEFIAIIPAAWWVSIYVYANEEDYSIYKKRIGDEYRNAIMNHFPFYTTGDACYISLDDGMVLEIKGGGDRYCIVRIPQKANWMP